MTDPDFLDLLCALTVLTDNEREAWVDNRLLNRSYTRIGEAMGLSDSRVCELAQAAEVKVLRESARMMRGAA